MVNGVCYVKSKQKTLNNSTQPVTKIRESSGLTKIPKDSSKSCSMTSVLKNTI